ncbi:conserved hypothetical protein of the DUF1178 family [Candidatus Kinetoplastibacterium blastocrithidii TCC012E]|uniref:DUF1178 family protein n=1 Tax=Candidatus Kinetoplastidibacterium blastocrithidiae TCC012E TaxID=1208922 RepID=M1LZX4_9PROT|nr:DUF1178 family protein [Candidatus Kinetoplastibacterium blastocrithidii]AFZ83514.1 hypothetical protein CKBE_00325 [Candidatus Kinetoplastibacterium blastocrithidii (ex Strigomonas culicis)]AGF49611.1 conserved hypothetical protein of the DUF1178 family [Candidatus Kinetoplastibacterium blastocrithidii TCC012E]
MTVKVFDLQCEYGHTFEGWFSSHYEFDDQHSRKMIECPFCSSNKITKLVSAPYVNTKLSPDANNKKIDKSSGKVNILETQINIIKTIRKILKEAENVGPNFAEEARKINNGDAEKRAIKGTVTKEEHQSLQNDEIEVLSIPEFLEDPSSMH